MSTPSRPHAEGTGEPRRAGHLRPLAPPSRTSSSRGSANSLAEPDRRYDEINRFQKVLERCSAPHAPWYLVPADHQWYRNRAVSRLLLEQLSDLDPRYPKADFDVAEARRRLLER